jgi:hypothetical protein
MLGTGPGSESVAAERNDSTVMVLSCKIHQAVTRRL